MKKRNEFATVMLCFSRTEKKNCKITSYNFFKMKFSTIERTIEAIHEDCVITKKSTTGKRLHSSNIFFGKILKGLETYRLIAPTTSLNNSRIKLLRYTVKMSGSGGGLGDEDPFGKDTLSLTFTVFVSNIMMTHLVQCNSSFAIEFLYITYISEDFYICDVLAIIYENVDSLSFKKLENSLANYHRE